MPPCQTWLSPSLNNARSWYGTLVLVCQSSAKLHWRSNMEFNSTNSSHAACNLARNTLVYIRSMSSCVCTSVCVHFWTSWSNFKWFDSRLLEERLFRSVWSDGSCSARQTFCGSSMLVHACTMSTSALCDKRPIVLSLSAVNGYSKRNSGLGAVFSANDYSDQFFSKNLYYNICPVLYSLRMHFSM